MILWANDGDDGGVSDFKHESYPQDKYWVYNSVQQSHLLLDSLEASETLVHYPHEIRDKQHHCLSANPETFMLI